MIWLVNGSKFKNNFYIKDFDDNSHWWFNKHDNTKTKKGKKIFKWEYPRRSWENLQRNVFIDFGDNQLFWVKTGMGTSSGTGLFIHKEKFIEKYEDKTFVIIVDYKFFHFFLSLQMVDCLIDGLNQLPDFLPLLAQSLLMCM